MSRTFGAFRLVMVGSPDYFRRAGRPMQPEDLSRHDCLLYRYPTTGKLQPWPLRRDGQPAGIERPAGMVTSTLEPQVCFAEQGLGIACVPDTAIRLQLDEGTPVKVLDDSNQDRTPHPGPLSAAFRTSGATQE